MSFINVFSIATLGTLPQSIRGQFLTRNDFPRYHPRATARRRSGSTDISRYGLAFHLPDKEFRYLRTVHSCYSLGAKLREVAGLPVQLSRSPVRSDYLIPEPGKAQGSAYSL